METNNMPNNNIRYYLTEHYKRNPNLPNGIKTKCSDGKFRDSIEKKLFDNIVKCNTLIDETLTILKDYQRATNCELKFINLSKFEDFSSNTLNNYFDFTIGCKDFVNNCYTTSNKSKTENNLEYYDKIDRYLSYLKRITDALNSIKNKVIMLLDKKSQAKKSQDDQIQKAMQLLEGTTSTSSKTQNSKVNENSIDIPLPPTSNTPSSNPKIDRDISEALKILDSHSNNTNDNEPEL